MIPQQLQQEGIRFCLIEKGTKKPFQIEWQKKNISYNDPVLIEHLKKGGNYGVMGGGDKKLLIVDFDDKQIQDELLSKLPETFTVRTGSGMMHKYFFSDGTDSFKIFNEEMGTLLDVQGEGKQCVGAGSTHPNGNIYEITDNRGIAFIPYAELKAIIAPYDKKPRKEKKEEELPPREYTQDNFLDVVKSAFSMESILSEFGVDTRRNPSNCPLHASKGGKCLGWNRETAHCFHCDGSWNIFSFVMEMKKCSFKEALEYLAEKGNLTKQLQESRQKWFDYQKSEERTTQRGLKAEFLRLISDKVDQPQKATELIAEHIKATNYIYTTKDDIKPEVWIYKEGVYIPQGRSEIKVLIRDILEEYYTAYWVNQILNKIEADTAINSEKFFGVNYVNELPVKNGILNILTGELAPFNPEKVFFAKLPVSYVPLAKCPAIEKFLGEVLSKDEDKKIFFELAGFILLKEYTYEKAFMFVGNGRNGKGKSLELLKRMVGAQNCSGVTLSALTANSFSLHELFGKLVNLAGDIENADLKETGMFKSLTGRDTISAKRKFLRDLFFQNYAKFVFACNDLPMVYDMSRGFWDRWILLEFPYTFVRKDEYDSAPDKTWLRIKDDNIIDKIATDEELSGLLNKALSSLKEIMAHKGFSVTQGTKEIKDLWIRKSNSFIAFAIDCLEEDADSFIIKKDLRRVYTKYCKKHGVIPKSDFMVKKIVQEMFGGSEDRISIGTYPDNQYQHVWQGIKIKDSLQ